MKIIAGLLLWLGLITNVLAVDCEPGKTCCPDMRNTSQPPAGWKIVLGIPAMQNTFNMATLLIGGLMSGAVCAYNNSSFALQKDGRYSPDPLFPLLWHPCMQTNGKLLAYCCYNSDRTCTFIQ